MNPTLIGYNLSDGDTPESRVRKIPDKKNTFEIKLSDDWVLKDPLQPLDVVILCFFKEPVFR